jgi:hypothetical protein
MYWKAGVRFGAGVDIFFFTTASRPAVGLNQLPIQWVLGAPSLGVEVTGLARFTTLVVAIVPLGHEMIRLFPFLVGF